MLYVLLTFLLLYSKARVIKMQRQSATHCMLLTEGWVCEPCPIGPENIIAAVIAHLHLSCSMTRFTCFHAEPGHAFYLSRLAVSFKPSIHRSHQRARCSGACPAAVSRDFGFQHLSKRQRRSLLFPNIHLGVSRNRDTPKWMV